MSSDHDTAIAIVGMAARVPGAVTVAQFWDNLQAGTEQIRFFERSELDPMVPAELADNPEYVPARGVLDGAELFDAPFFAVSPPEAEIMDPQQRQFLELCWEALEDAGHAPHASRFTTGVYAGMGNNHYYLNHVLANPGKLHSFGEFAAMVANEKDFLASRVCYKLNLHGPGISLYTACSTSLVAVCQAMDGLLNYQCDMALAGGISILLPQLSGHLYRPGNILSRSGHCRAFDAGADGTVFGNGGGVVVLRRLADAIADRDHLYAILRGGAVNNDGGGKMSFMAPSAEGQAQAVAAAQAMAGVTPDTIGYIEAHGTGTLIGDPIEIAGLTNAFALPRGRQATCPIGSVKTNIGHLDTAAGVAGLIKTALMLRYRTLVPSINFREPNPHIDFPSTPFFVQQHTEPWQANVPLRAGVSSFGVGGTNAHVVLEEAPPYDASRPSPAPRQLFVLSAATETALHGAAAALRDCLESTVEHPDDVAFTLQEGRRHFPLRRFEVAADTRELAALLSREKPPVHSPRSAPESMFLFPGQGSLYPGMGTQLYAAHPLFRDTVDRCAAELGPHLGRDIREVLFGDADALLQTAIQQPALFVIEYALAKLWMHHGVTPTALIGHSIGEYAAACIAGIVDLPTALRLVCARGALMQKMQPGAMLSVTVSADELAPLLVDGVGVAADNAPNLAVCAGSIDAIGRQKELLDAKGIRCGILKTSHAFHSPMMEPAQGPFRAVVSEAVLSAPCIPMVSTVSGTWLTDSEAQDPEYWVGQICKPVRFNQAVATILAKDDVLLLETGPGRQAITMAARHGPDPAHHYLVAGMDKPADEYGALLSAAGAIWARGGAIAAGSFFPAHARRIPLPTYRFDHKRYWLLASRLPVPPADTTTTATPQPGDDTKPQAETAVRPSNETLARIWCELTGETRIDPQSRFIDIGGDSILAAQASALIEQETATRIPPTELLLNTLSQLCQKFFPTPVAESTAPPPAETGSGATSIREHLFFGPQNQLYGVIHGGNGTTSHAVLLCPPIGHEYVRSYYALLNLAQRISGAGFAVMRFDLYGQGNSQGASADGSIERWTNDVIAAARCLAEKSGAATLTLAGVRAGASLVMRASCQENSLASGLILWDPVVSGHEMIRDFDRLHRTGNPAIPSDGPQFMGYRYGADQLRSIEALDLRALKPRLPTALFTTSQNPSYAALQEQLRAAGLLALARYENEECGWSAPASFEKVLLVRTIAQGITNYLRESCT